MTILLLENHERIIKVPQFPTLKDNGPRPRKFRLEFHTKKTPVNQQTDNFKSIIVAYHLGTVR